MSITWSAKLKELQQGVAKAQERQWKCNDQLGEFQDIGTQLPGKGVVVPQAVHDGKKEVNSKMVDHSLKQDHLTFQDIAVKFKAQVAEIS